MLSTSLDLNYFMVFNTIYSTIVDLDKLMVDNMVFIWSRVKEWNNMEFPILENPKNKMHAPHEI